MRLHWSENTQRNNSLKSKKWNLSLKKTLCAARYDFLWTKNWSGWDRSQPDNSSAFDQEFVWTFFRKGTRRERNSPIPIFSSFRDRRPTQVNQRQTNSDEGLLCKSQILETSELSFSCKSKHLLHFQNDKWSVERFQSGFPWNLFQNVRHSFGAWLPRLCKDWEPLQIQHGFLQGKAYF